MDSSLMIYAVAGLAFLALAGIGFVLTSDTSDASKRARQLKEGKAGTGKSRAAPDAATQRRRQTQQMLKKLRKQDEARGADSEMLHVGIANRGFERRFELADHVRVSGADLADGLLVIDLLREVPEAMKPKKIAINGQKSSLSLVDGSSDKSEKDAA